MTQYRVIVVDDEILLRQGLSARLGSSPDLKVIGVCSSGPAVLDRLAGGATDAIVLDLDMNCSEPETLLKQIRDKHPEVLVLAIAPSETFLRRIPHSLTTPGRSEAIVRPRQSTTAEAFLDDLAIVIRKRLLEMLRVSERSRSTSMATEIAPEARSAVVSIHQDARSGTSTIAPEAKSTIHRGGMQAQSSTTEPKPHDRADAPPSRPAASDAGSARLARRVEVLAIASSTGGPQALTDLLTQLPRDFPVPILIVQHMPAEFTKNLADRLDAICALKIREAIAGESLLPGTALIAPGDLHMTIQKGENRTVTIGLNQGPMENSCRPAADVLFRAVARIFGPSTLGVVLTGMGKDGLAGTRAIRESGGRVIVQDEASSVVWGMPGEIARAGLADAILPLKEMPSEILRRIAVGRI